VETGNWAKRKFGNNWKKKIGPDYVSGGGKKKEHVGQKKGWGEVGKKLRG